MIHKDKNLEERIVQAGFSEGPTGAVTKQVTQSSVETAKARLCSSCLVDKTRATTHCSRCGLCVVALDHHCAFVNNCVGRGNRRVFVLFTLSASIGCALCAILSIYVQYTASDYCPYIGRGSLLNLFSVQHCVAKKDLAFVVLVWLAILSSTWIGSICLSQLSFVAGNTTSYLVMKGKHDGSCGLFSPVGMRNILHFLQTGTYTAVPMHRDDLGGRGGAEDFNPFLDASRGASSDKKEEDQEEEEGGGGLQPPPKQNGAATKVSRSIIQR
jgi:hypothetical protein